jgi:hypothetical protein
MARITIGGSLLNALRGLTQGAELFDLSGKVIGQFVPVIDLSDWEPLSPELSEEELDRREQSSDWYSTEEVAEYLKSLQGPQ